MQSSRLPLRKWVIAFYLLVTNLKGVSSMKLYRDLGISQKSAWHMLHRIREAMRSNDPLFRGPVEADETYIGGRARNLRLGRRGLGRGRGVANHTAVLGLRDRPTRQVAAMLIEHADRATLFDYVEGHTTPEATVYTDEWPGYVGINRLHETVRHSVGEYVSGMASTNGMESFWAALKRGYQGVYHWMSRKYLHRYIVEFERRHNVRPLDTIDQMRLLVEQSIGKHLPYEELVGQGYGRASGQMRMV